jgi:predicted AlkP superfamily phosphohydrolase/phosphomutase
MLSSQDPGQLGGYGFRNRADHSYAGLRMATSRDVREPRVWDLVGRAGGRSVVIGVPGTYPPPAIDGLVVADFLTPGVDAAFTHPGAARARVLDLEPDYRFDVSDFRRRNEDSLVADVTTMTRRRFRLARALAAQPWDFFALHEIGTDRLHHRLFPQRFDEPDSDGVAARLLAYYRVLDEEIGLLLDALPADTRVVVGSDHGARAMHGGVRINQWLADHGYLRLRPGAPTDAVNPETVDWDRTAAWGEGGYYARVYLNVAGREPRGTLSADEVPGLLAELRDGLGDVRDGDGRRMATRLRDELRARGVPCVVLVESDGFAAEAPTSACAALAAASISTVVVADPARLPSLVADLHRNLPRVVAAQHSAEATVDDLEATGWIPARGEVYTEDELETVTARLQELGYA